jgi:hypothetical protein
VNSKRCSKVRIPKMRNFPTVIRTFWKMSPNSEVLRFLFLKKGGEGPKAAKTVKKRTIQTHLMTNT